MAPEVPEVPEAAPEAIPDRSSALLALASLMDQRKTINDTEQWMFNHGVPIEQIVELRKQEAEVCRQLMEQGRVTAPDGTPRAPRVEKGQTVAWLIPLEPNPNREGSQRWDGFNLLKTCTTVAEFNQKGGKPDFIRWALHKKWIELK
jgi:hypothetical protein